jgi:hypothetical protein
MLQTFCSLYNVPHLARGKKKKKKRKKEKATAYANGV